MTKMYIPTNGEGEILLNNNEISIITDDKITGDRKIMKQVGKGYSITLIPGETIKLWMQKKIEDNLILKI